MREHLIPACLHCLALDLCFDAFSIDFSLALKLLLLQLQLELLELQLLVLMLTLNGLSTSLPS